MGAALGDQALGVFGLLVFRLDGFFLNLVADIGRLVVALDGDLLGAYLVGLALGVAGGVTPQVAGADPEQEGQEDRSETADHQAPPMQRRYSALRRVQTPPQNPLFSGALQSRP